MRGRRGTVDDPRARGGALLCEPADGQRVAVEARPTAPGGPRAAAGRGARPSSAIARSRPSRRGNQVLELDRRRAALISSPARSGRCAPPRRVAGDVAVLGRRSGGCPTAGRSPRAPCSACSRDRAAGADARRCIAASMLSSGSSTSSERCLSSAHAYLSRVGCASVAACTRHGPPRSRRASSSRGQARRRARAELRRRFISRSKVSASPLRVNVRER